MTSTQMMYLGAVVLYLIGMALISELGRRKTIGISDFWVAGRGLGAWVTGFAYQATHLSAAAFIGAVGLVYFFGPGMVLWIAIGQGIAFPIVFLVIGPRIRGLSGKLNLMTFPDFFRERFQSTTIGILAAVIIIGAFIPFVVMQYVGVAYLCFITLGLPHAWGLVIGGLLMAVFVMRGGMFGVAWTDFFQAIVLVGGMVMLVVAIFTQVGAPGPMISSFVTDSPIRASLWGPAGAQFALALGFMYGLGQLAIPHTTIRLFAVRTDAISRSLGTSSIVVILINTYIMYLGVASAVLIPDLAAPDLAVPTLVTTFLPPLLGGFLVAAILSGIFSSTNPVLHQIGAALGRDIYQRVINPAASEAKLLRVGRVAILLAGILSFTLAFRPPAFINLVVAWVWGIFGVSFSIPLLAGLFWRRANKQGALASMLLGSVVYVGWTLSGKPLGIEPIYVGVLVSVLCLVLGTYLFPRPPEKLVRTFFPGKAS